MYLRTTLTFKKIERGDKIAYVGVLRYYGREKFRSKYFADLF